MIARTLIVLFLTVVHVSCSHAGTPAGPDPSLRSLRVDSVSTSITTADFRSFSIRVRVTETSGSPLTISGVALQIAGGAPAATRTFSDIGTIVPAHSSIDLDDLRVDDPAHQLESASTIAATVTYRTHSGHTDSATGTGVVPSCSARFDVWGSGTMGVGESMQMHGGFEAGCSPMFYPLDGSQIQWRSLNPDVAGVNASGVVAGLAIGSAMIQGTYARVVSSHSVTVKQ